MNVQSTGGSHRAKYSLLALLLIAVASFCPASAAQKQQAVGNTHPVMQEAHPTVKSAQSAQSAYEKYRWRKPDPHIPFPDARKPNAAELAEMAKVRLASAFDYSRYVTLTRDQGRWGGCGAMTALAILDILKERENPYTPDSSYRFNEYFYNDSRDKAPEPYKLNQADVIQIIGSIPESDMPSDYDPEPSALPVPTARQYNQAKLLQIASYSDLLWPLTSDQIKRLLVRYGPLCAIGDFFGAGHVWTLVGYDDSKRAFKVLNSASDNWGENGYYWMPYANVDRPTDKTTPRIIEGIRYVVNKPTPRGAYPFVARINIHHDMGRNYLIVKVGVDGQPAKVVWNHPNIRRNPDQSKNLVIDVALPDYAGNFWPPSEKNRWYVEIKEDSYPSRVEQVWGRINDVVLVDRRGIRAEGKMMPVLYRPSRVRMDLNRGDTVKMYVAASERPGESRQQVSGSTDSQAGTKPSGRMKCVSLNPAAVQVYDAVGRFRIAEGSFQIDFGPDASGAVRGTDIIRYYGLDQYCCPDVASGFSYFTVQKRSPRGAMQNEDCIPFNPSSLSINRTRDEWGVVDGNVWLFGTGQDQELAKTALGIIKSYQFNNMCFAGAPKRVMIYFRR